MLSDRQYRILSFIYEHTAENGFGPSIREICQASEISSTSAVNYNMEQLVIHGYLMRAPGKARAFTLTGAARELFEDHYVTDTDRLREEIRLLTTENERLRRKYQNRITMLTPKVKTTKVPNGDAAIYR